MYSIRISNETNEIIHEFILWYRKTFLELFDDTGIEDEELIREVYIKSSKEFKNQIYRHLSSTLQTDVILWNSPKEDDVFMITIPINNFRLFVYYTEDNDSKTRFIEDIEFFKK